MKKPINPVLIREEKEALEQCLGDHSSAAVRSRCQLILLKAQARLVADIAAITDRCVISVHSRVKRYRSQGGKRFADQSGQRKKEATEKYLAEVGDKRTVNYATFNGNYFL